MEINIKILNKFNRYQMEVMDYYNLDGEVYISTFEYNGEIHQIYTFNIVPLGYKLNKVDVGVDDGYMTMQCLANRIRFLEKDYPLLPPFYSFSSYLIQDKIIRNEAYLKRNIFEQLNDSIKYIRSRKDEQNNKA